MKGPYWLCGTMQPNGRTGFYGKTVQELEREAKRLNLREWAIYRNDQHFHSTTQKEYLVKHFNDQYWINKGVEGIKK